MKQCPKCKNFYQDDDDFCPEDGSALAEDGGNRVVVSWDEKPAELAPTQFIPPPPMPPNSVPQQSGGSNGILYALIGALVAVVIVGAVYILNSGPSNDTKWSSVSPTATPTGNQGQAAKPANTEAPSNKSASVANSNTVNLSSNSKSLERTFRNSYGGTLDGHGIQMQLERDGRSLGGKVTPTRQNAADIYLDGMIEDDGSFVLDEKSDTGVVTGIYRGRISADGEMSGTWTKPNGDRACSFSLSKQ